MKLAFPRCSSIVPIECKNFTNSIDPMEMHRARLQNLEVCVP